MDYKEATENFRAISVLAATFHSEQGDVNAAEICCDRHALGDAIALRHRNKSGIAREWTFAEIRSCSAKFARVLSANGVRKGDRVAALLPRTPALLISILATWRLGAVYHPLFTAFGPKAVSHRLHEAETKFVVTDHANRSKIENKDITVACIDEGAAERPDISFWPALEAQQEMEELVDCDIDDPFLMMFTSGTTGPAKALDVPIRAIASFKSYMKDAVGLKHGDRFWNLADPGWAYGLYYSIVGPLSMGVATTFNESNFSPEDTFETIRDLKIENLAGSPTAYRLLIAAQEENHRALKGQLKAVSSAGEPLNPEVIRWFKQELAVSVHDHYGQTEIGMVLCNHHGLKHKVRVGSAGFAAPGFRIVVVSEGGQELPPGQPGILAVDCEQSPMMWFHGYRGLDPSSAFRGRYYLSGDNVEQNEDGSISFVGRADDVITTSGYRVGPFEVESALIEYPAVLESAVIGKPDAERTEIVKAYVVLREGYKPSEKLTSEMQNYVKRRLSAHSYPREIEFVASLPKTPSGKLQRFLLRNEEISRSRME